MKNFPNRFKADILSIGEGFSSRGVSFFLLALILTITLAQAQVKIPPQGIVPGRNGKQIHKVRDLDKKFDLSNLSIDQEENIFPLCCFEGDYYVGFKMYMDDPDFEVPTTGWTSDFTFGLYEGITKMWEYELTLNMGEQIVLDQVFHGQIIPFAVESDWHIKVLNISGTGTVPTENITLGVEFYRVRENDFDEGYDLNLSVSLLSDNTIHDITWQKPPAGGIMIDRYELEWVFIDADATDQPNNNASAFTQKDPIRITTQMDQYILNVPHTKGKIWYRVRYVGMNPDFSSHELLGDWEEGNDLGYSIENIEEGNNWQRVTSFAEGGKSKSVVSYYDGLLKPKQVLTNLSEQGVTMVAESKYDFEGRKVMDFLPVPMVGNGFDFSEQNQFIQPGYVEHYKEAYDNGGTANGLLSTSVADNYYNNATDLGIPSSNGYPYTQISYTHDNLGRVNKQSGVGQKFNIDGEKTVNYFYGTASKEELDWLFGTGNYGQADHYQKNLVQDANGQVSVTYTDAAGRTIATALAGDPTENMDGLNLSDYNLNVSSPFVVDLSDRYELTDGSRVTIYKILNAVTTNYTFTSVFRALAATMDDIPCQACKYDIDIRVIDPDGVEALSASAVDVTATDCNVQLVQNVSLTGNSTFSKIGDYTISKIVRPHKLTYEEIKVEVLSSSVVQAQSITIANNVPAIDVSFCDVNTSTIDPGETIIPEMALKDCENIKQTIISEILEGANPSGLLYDDLIAYFNDYENLSSGNDVFDHSLFCQYTSCMDNMESEIFDDKLYLIENWTDAIAAYKATADPANTFTVVDLVDSDPYFSSSLEGTSEKQTILDRLNSLEIERNDPDTGDSETSIFGPLDEMVDPTNTTYLIDIETGKMEADLGAPPANGIHFLYLNIITNNPGGDNSAEIDEARWQLYRSFYLDEKRRIQKEIAVANSCQALVDEYDRTNAANPLKGYPNLISDDIQQWGEDQGASGEITSEELDVLVSVMAFHCDITFSESDTVSIRSHLRNYFAGRGMPTLRYIIKDDITAGNTSLASIQGYLGSCSLEESPLVIDLQCNKFMTDITYINNNEGPYDLRLADPDTNQCLTFDGSDYTSATGPLTISNTDDRNLLIDMYDDMDGTNWEFADNTKNWYASAALKNDYCDMEGVYSTASNGRLRWIDIRKKGISGNLPVFQNFNTDLRALSIDFNNIGGDLANLDGIVDNLIYLNVSGNHFQDISNAAAEVISRVPTLYLSDNYFTFEDLIPVGLIRYDESISSSSLGTQNKVGKATTIDVEQGQNITLTVNIDRGLATQFGDGVVDSEYEWWFDPAGDGLMNPSLVSTSFDEDNYTFVVENVSPSDEGVYFYKIRNLTRGVDDVILIGNDITLNVESCTAPFSGGGCNDVGLAGCLQYSQDLFALDLNIEIAKYKNQCEANLEADRQAIVKQQQEDYLQTVINDYVVDYAAQCLDNIDETFTFSYEPKEYHHTLYYYNRAGNLVQTVPPKGVKYGMNGAHAYRTQYRYNSLNQLVEQETPDHGGTDPNDPEISIPGITRFRYNSKGQLRLSQNPQQKFDEEYSYTKYDRQGRITEVGKLSYEVDLLSAANSGTLATLLNDEDFPDEITYDLSELTRTYYDLKVAGASPTFTQSYLRGRVAQVEVLPDVSSNTNTTRTYYSYDPHGNVKSLMQEIPGLEPKRIDYVYDLVSGNVNYVFYQYGEDDSFMHKYSYDADNRITTVATSTDGLIWNQDAVYEYYPHGPLKNVQLGEKNIQQLDYYYTLQGWLKGVNVPFDGSPFIQSPNFAKDEFAMTLGYFDGDFEPKAGMTDIADRDDNLWAMYQHADTYNVGEDGTGLYNGNISWMNTWLDHVGEYNDEPEKGMNAMAYRYDQLNRIIASKGLGAYDPGAGGYQARGSAETYDTDYSYDPNGNLGTLIRKDQNGLVMDNFEYQYASGRNRLTGLEANEVEVKHISSGSVSTGDKIYPTLNIGGSARVGAGETVVVQATESVYLEDGFVAEDGGEFTAYISDASAVTAGSFTFKYDYIGNIIENHQDGTEIDWTVYGKVNKVTLDAGGQVAYTYDAAGNRTLKKTTDVEGNSSTTHYVRDASGNVMAVYKDGALAEQPIYGSSRLGQYTGGGNVSALSHQLGMRHYELTNHLGNVMAVVSDELYVDAEGTHLAKTISTADYYPFGLDMPGRSLSASSMYRYGFNGKEKDIDLGGGTTATYDYGFRIYNPSIARFLSVDPLTSSYPWYTPYQFAGNKPIMAIDLDGLEEYIAIKAKNKTGSVVRVIHDSGLKEELDMNKKEFRSMLKVNEMVQWNSTAEKREYFKNYGGQNRNPSPTGALLLSYSVDGIEASFMQFTKRRVTKDPRLMNAIGNLFVGSTEIAVGLAGEGISVGTSTALVLHGGTKFGIGTVQLADYVVTDFDDSVFPAAGGVVGMFTGMATNDKDANAAAAVVDFFLDVGIAVNASGLLKGTPIIGSASTVVNEGSKNAALMFYIDINSVNSLMESIDNGLHNTREKNKQIDKQIDESIENLKE
ncbi:RHS repeat-associated core domain-containing protein [Reichenbachiella sp. MALMAid0571]|uniref:RHS repeat-associated core domain-containing protein n=1 Tax=Reichenbachiella sp. MALMAid0571 TaxID=3143939 RepID=UPI0032DF8E45